MRVRLTLQPGRRGTKKLLREFGDRLVCVRYRYDEAGRRRLKTAEIIVDERSWIPDPERTLKGYRTVNLTIDYHEKNLRVKIKRAGGTWNPEKRAWELPFYIVRQLGLENRILH